MSNSTQPHMQNISQEEHSRVLEQQIFTRGVLGYCTHFNIPAKNYYNINFAHFQDFEYLYHQEKFLKQNLSLALEHSSPDFPCMAELNKALENILIAKNNYQRIMLQMLDTIYYQEQQAKQHSVFLELHNTITSRNESQTQHLKNALSYLTTNQQPVSQSPAAHNSVTEKASRRDTSKTPRNTSERKRPPSQTPSNYSSQRAMVLKQRELNIEVSYMSKQSKRSAAPCLSYRAKSPQMSANTQKTYQTPRTQSISTSRHNSISTARSGREETNKNAGTKKPGYFARRGSETTYSSKFEEMSGNGFKEQQRRSSLKSQKSTRETQGNQTTRYRNTSCALLEQDIEEKRLISISSIQEDCNDHEYDSFKASKARTMPNNDRGELPENSGGYHYKENDYRLPWKENKLGSEYLATTQNKSISFQSSTGNVFMETENNARTSPQEDLVLREVGNHRDNCVWPRETINTDRDQIYVGGKSWDLLEGNFVTSPSFGMQTVYTERSFSQKHGMNGDSKIRGKLERCDKRQGENLVLGKFYGSGIMLKKKTWAPLLAKKC